MTLLHRAMPDAARACDRREPLAACALPQERQAMTVRRMRQIAPLEDEGAALRAVTAHILAILLDAAQARAPAQSAWQDPPATIMAADRMTLATLPYLRAQAADIAGLCFEYALHEAIRTGAGTMLGRIGDAMALCRVAAAGPASLLFGLEASGAAQLIDSPAGLLTRQSVTMAGATGRPRSLTGRLNVLTAAFRRRAANAESPATRAARWKPELFIGSAAAQCWIGTSVKMDARHLEAAATLRIGIVPMQPGKGDRVRLDEERRLVICPLPWDARFLQTVRTGWRLLGAFFAAGARAPAVALLPHPIAWDVCRMLEERRELPVQDVLEVLGLFGQSGLLETDCRGVVRTDIRGRALTDRLLAPVPLATA